MENQTQDISKEIEVDSDYALFLDDERYPSFLKDRVHTTPIHKHELPWIICRNQKEAEQIVERLGVPTVISFDNDLGDDMGSGLDFARYLVEQHLLGKLDTSKIKYQVHSRNPVAALKIDQLMHELTSGNIPFGVGNQSAFEYTKK